MQSLLFTDSDVYNFENYFISEKNTVALECLKQQELPPRIFLYGLASSGLTHLLCAACKVAQRPIYLNMRDLVANEQWNLMQGIDSCDLIAIDDLQELSGHKEGQQELFHLFNRIRAQNGSLLLASHTNLNDIEFCLPDIASRLASSVSIYIEQLSNDELADAIRLRLQSRGIIIEDRALDFMLLRLPQDVGEMMSRIDIICTHVLDMKKSITIPLIKEVLRL